MGKMICLLCKLKSRGNIGVSSCFFDTFSIFCHITETITTAASRERPITIRIGKTNSLEPAFLRLLFPDRRCIL